MKRREADFGLIPLPPGGEESRKADPKALGQGQGGLPLGAILPCSVDGDNVWLFPGTRYRLKGGGRAAATKLTATGGFIQQSLLAHSLEAACRAVPSAAS